MSNKERESRSFWEEEDSLLLENDRKRRRRVMGLEAPEPVTEREPGGPRIRQTDKPLPALKVWHSEVGGKEGRGASKGEPFFSPRTFAEVGASVELQSALAACGAVTPSHVQAAGYDVIAAGKDVILADQTGSGKTLGYLGPVVQRLRELERRDGKTPPGQVRAIVLAPTAELAQQVLRVAKSLSAGGAPFRSTIVTGEHKWGTQRKALAAGVELVVATPGRLRSHLNAERPSLQLGGLAHLVLDEADSNPSPSPSPSPSPNPDLDPNPNPNPNRKPKPRCSTRRMCSTATTTSPRRGTSCGPRCRQAPRSPSSPRR